MSAKKTRKNGRLVVYRSYNFVDKDPAIDVVRTMAQASKKSYRQIYEAGGPTPSTLYNWFDGKTRRPQFCTLIAAARSTGGDIQMVTRTGQVIKLPHGMKGRIPLSVKLVGSGK